MKEELKENEKSIRARWDLTWDLDLALIFEAEYAGRRKVPVWTWAFQIENGDYDSGFCHDIREGRCGTREEVMVKLHNAREIVRQIWEAL